MFIGGEFYEDEAWGIDTPAPPIDGAIFLYGGRACLSAIATYLNANNYSKILLPSYLCPSILDVLDQNSIKYEFYQINEDLSIDLDDMQVKAAHLQVIYFINYFGFQHSPDTLSVLRQLQSAGKLLIEDNAQAGFLLKRIGDFCFNSMRKLAAVDGGYLATRNIPLPHLENLAFRENHRLPLIREYRHLLRSYLYQGRGSHEELERLFYQAERYYEQDNVILGDDDEREKIEHLNWQAIKAARRANYEYLCGKIIGLPGITPIYPALQSDNMPLGLPVFISNYSRDLLIDKLAEMSISLTVHWDALLTDPRTRNNPGVTNIARQILTLPVDQYTSRSQINFLVDALTKLIR